ncbi:hypothetical protein EIN_181620 [Entamoeba invadens IP1]|uniref:FAR-17a/AIG1-like protein n=1 Tax=Entamoeba invadens TaxID=33085 RepID=S0B331_ENTIV|nr:hypothetical protein EIN_181620 [Entamoeba invadens IP1]ELP93995.1 hypothetical protein EIN_181620 [Entamoeba invadens IP1]BAN40946.1 hypothetical protein [Entamoeba invadens]|eukprot:XP_004260766.1 hypothetical protein EIN_181620 [Entamoeba invadens IP1]
MKVNEVEKQLTKMKTFYRLLFDFCVVTFIFTVTTRHMIHKNYTFGRMCRFWTMWSCWACLLYFFVAFCKQLSLLLFDPSFIKRIRSDKANFLVDVLNQLAFVLCLCVTLMFWVLFFKSPSNVLRIDGEWQPTFVDQLFVTHFEHTFPFLFLLIDCLLFAQGSKHIDQFYSISKFSPVVAFFGYCGLCLKDYFDYGIRPYPFMDKWTLMMLLATIVVVCNIISCVFNPITYYIRSKLSLVL